MFILLFKEISLIVEPKLSFGKVNARREENEMNPSFISYPEPKLNLCKVYARREENEMNPSFISNPEPKLNLCKVNKNQDRLFPLHTNS